MRQLLCAVFYYIILRPQGGKILKEIEDKVKLTISIDVATRQIIAKYTRPRAIGALMEKLVKRYDMECRYGPAKLDSRLSRIEDKLGELAGYSHKIPSH